MHTMKPRLPDAVVSGRSLGNVALKKKGDCGLGVAGAGQRHRRRTARVDYKVRVPLRLCNHRSEKLSGGPAGGGER